MTLFRKDQTLRRDLTLQHEEVEGVHIVIALTHDDERLRSIVGERSASKIASTGRAGLLTYGPFAELPAGWYTVAIYGETFVPPHATARVEILADAGERLLAQRTLTTRDDGVISESCFFLDRGGEDVDIRIHVDAMSHVAITDIRIAEVSSSARHSSRSREVVFSNEETQAELISVGSDTVVVSFQSFGCTGFDRLAFEEAFFPSIGIDSICFKPLRNIWYQDLTTGAVEHRLRKLLAPYRRRIAYGVSMGGYAALYFGAALGAEKIVAVSPQFSPRPGDVPFDQRWLETRRRMGYTHLWRVPVSIPALFVFDDDEAEDKRHIELLKEIFPLHDERPLLFSGHPTAISTAESQPFLELLKGIIEN